ncbi:TonB-dependent receptor [Kordiimonas sediminis]|uniref:TonB-dependent receptor n=2 Tax=Kordiimonas sediminis TaxID=1735581 RepID=A0A919AP35_9PROT|nr:TonB-dependent receptor [Kordiimonas sediminis]
MAVPAAAFAQEQVAIEEVVVVGQYIPDEKRATSEISSVVDADAMSLTGDSDIAVALTRLPGISPDSSGKYVVVRGLSERYTSTLLNGTELSSPDPLKRSVPLDIFPTSLISSVLVQKTYSAEYPGAFGGGVVDIRTKAVPDEAFLTLGVSTGVNTESTFKKGLQYDGSGTDWLGFDNGRRSLPKLIADNPTLEGYSPEEIERAGESFPNVWSLDYEPNRPDLDVKASAGKAWDTEDGSFGFIVALDYGSELRNKNGIRKVYSASDATESGLEATQGNYAPDQCEEFGLPGEDCGVRITNWNIDLNMFGSFGWQINDQHAVKLTSVLLRSSQQQVEVKQGGNNSRDIANYTRLDWKERQLWSNALTGEHSFNLFGGDNDMELEWFASLAKAKRDVPLRRTYEYFYDDIDGVFRLSDRTDGNQTAFGAMNDESKNIGFNFLQPAYLGDMIVDFKGGASYVKKDRVSDYKRYGFDLSNVENTELREMIPEIIFGSVNIDPNGIILKEFIDASDRFEADFENKGGFVQADAQVTETLRVSGGVRYEDSVQTVLTTDRTTKDPILVTQRLDTFLPSATITWEFAENLQVRLGASETVNRPDSRELSPARFVREDGRTEEGNPYLEPATIRSYDARFEWYIGAGESVTAGLFYKEIDNPIEYTLKQFGDGELDTMANAEKAELKGIELEVEKILGQWGDREIFVKANGSYIDSESTRTVENFGEITNLVGRLQGQSKWLANLQVGFEDFDRGEKLNVIVNYIGKRIYRLGSTSRPDLIEKPPLELNFVYGRDVDLWGQTFALTFKAKNLLNESPERTQGGEIAEMYDEGRTFTVGVSTTF